MLFMANVFYNDSIFDSYQDYVLGGFVVEDGQYVDYNTICNAISGRLKYLIEDFYIRGWAANTETNVDYTEEDAMTQIAFMIKDNLGFYPSGMAIDNLHTAIMNSEHMVKWKEETIKSRVQEYFSKEVPQFEQNNEGIVNYLEKAKREAPMLYNEAESATYETTLEDYIEQLSLIEL
jgi:hypothetical protein